MDLRGPMKGARHLGALCSLESEVDEQPYKLMGPMATAFDVDRDHARG